MSIQDTLDERQKQHGSFSNHSEIETELMRVVVKHMPAVSFTDVQRVGLHMVIHKLARVLNNGHNHADTWHDIAGYSVLVEQDVIAHNKEKAKIDSDLTEIANER